jgi:hypothetical protein
LGHPDVEKNNCITYSGLGNSSFLLTAGDVLKSALDMVGKNGY